MHKLTDRQRDVLFYAACGMGEKETARELNLSKNTVNDYRKQAMCKMGATNITHAVVVAISKGYILPRDCVGFA